MPSSNNSDNNHQKKTPASSLLSVFHQTPLIIFTIAEFASDSLHQANTLSQISKIWYSIIISANNATGVIQLWERAAACSCMSLKNNGKIPSSSSLLPSGCSPLLFHDSNNKNEGPPEYLMSRVLGSISSSSSSPSSSAMTKSCHNNNNNSPQVAAALKFCIATDGIIECELGTKEEEEQDAEMLSFVLLAENSSSESAQDIHRNNNDQIKFLGNTRYSSDDNNNSRSNRCCLPSTEILRLNFLRDGQQVSPSYDILLREQKYDDDNRSNGNLDENEEQDRPEDDGVNNNHQRVKMLKKKPFPCWRVDTELFKVLKHCSVNINLSEDEREDNDVVLFDTLEAFFVKSYCVKDDDDGNASYLGAKLQCFVLKKRNQGKKLMNFIRFSIEDLAAQSREGRTGQVEMMSAM